MDAELDPVDAAVWLPVDVPVADVLSLVPDVAPLLVPLLLPTLVGLEATLNVALLAWLELLDDSCGLEDAVCMRVPSTPASPYSSPSVVLPPQAPSAAINTDPTMALCTRMRYLQGQRRSTCARPAHPPAQRCHGGGVGYLHGNPMRFSRSIAALASITALSVSSGCFFRGGGGLFFAVADTAILTAVIVSATAPPPPRVVFVPEPRPGFAWQPGYWTLHDGNWIWVEGGWVELQPGYAWAPAHWEQTPDGNWQLLPGHWVGAGQEVAPERPPPPPPPPPAAGPPPANGVQYIPAPQ